MELLTKTQLQNLATLEASPCISIYFPALGGAHTGRQDHVRLENLLRRATSELAARGVDTDEAGELLAPAWALDHDETFWAAPAGGVALFAAPGFFRRVRVDYPFPEAVRIGERFSTRPLLPIVDRPEQFLVLSVSRKRVRLLEATATGCHELHLPGLPASFQAAMGYVDGHREISAHTASSAALGRRGAILHGDAGAESAEADLEHFCQKVIGAIERGLANAELPMVIAAVEETVPFLRRASARLNLLDETIRGNADSLSDAELVELARERVAAALERALDGELVRWSELRGSGRSFDDLEEIVRAADQGRVETLFVAREAERWGSYEPDLCRVAVHERPEPGDEELLDFAVSRTIAQRGEAHELPLAAMPDGRVAVALLRWAQAA